MNAGIGYGGSCFPKDCRALIQTAHKLKVDASIFEAIEKTNNIQKNWVIDQLNNHFNATLKNRTIAVWGLTFKPGTDDIREASSLTIIYKLLQASARLRLYDPIAMGSAKAIIGEHDSIKWCNSPEEALLDRVDALVIATEWPIFKLFPLKKIVHYLGEAPIFDGRNCFNLDKVKESKIAYYYSVGRPSIISDIAEGNIDVSSIVEEAVELPF